MLTVRRRIVLVLAVLLGAPVCAELLQAYLATTGDLWAVLGVVLFLAPLYGGAALLIREVAVRTRRGWGCRLLLATAFGLAMTGIIDLSLFGAENPEIAYWEEIRAPTAINALGLSVAPLITWVAGHVVMSVGAPLALLEGLAPAHRGRPLLGRIGIPVLVAGWLVVAALVFVDNRDTYDYVPSAWQAGGVVVVIALLVVAALSRLGDPVPLAMTSRGVPVLAVLAGGAAGKVALDLLPPTWLGVVLDLALFAAAVVVIGWLARHRRWGAREVGLLGASAVVAGAALGFMTPVPLGASAVGKYAQSAVLVCVCLVLAALVVRRTAQVPSRTSGNTNVR